MKYCNDCSTEKHEEEFYKSKAAKDGLQVRCKSCSAKRAVAHRIAHPEKCAASRSKYYLKNKELVLELSRKNYQANKERKAETVKAWRKENPDKVREIKKKGYAKHREKSLAYSKSWQQANKAAVAAHSSKRRAIKRGAEGSYTAKDVDKIFEAQKGVCANCTKKLVKSGKNRYHVDHIIPLAKGGSNWPSNLQCLCPYCNQSKSDKTPEEWARINGRLI